MTASSSMIRLCLYVLIAILTTALSTLEKVDFSDWKQIATWIGSFTLSGLVTARSYIDKSPSEVIREPDKP